MSQLLFATSNAEKYHTAKLVCATYGVELIQKKLKIDEIQAEDAEKVARDKALKAFELLQEPVIISDDSWSFAGLKGFPGVYMHSINSWLIPEDFLRLTLPLTDRQVVFTQFIVYQDKNEQKVFTAETEGELLKNIQGTSIHASHTIISMKGDNGASIAEVHEKPVGLDTRKAAQIWHDFGTWYRHNLKIA